MHVLTQSIIILCNLINVKCDAWWRSEATSGTKCGLPAHTIWMYGRTAIGPGLPCIRPIVVTKGTHIRTAPLSEMKFCHSTITANSSI